MTKPPILPTILVAAAAGVMVWLGFWQLGRAEEKAILLDQYDQAENLPEMAWPLVPDPQSPPLYRKSGFLCREVVDWRQTSGRSIDDEPGLIHIASCSLGGGEGPGAQFVAGWSKGPLQPNWEGGNVTGVIAPDGGQIIRLVTNKAVAGLKDVAPPSPKDLPNNHLAYAVQWFLFAAIASIIYVLAARGRSKKR